jgi:site-specific recombinase XerD
MSPSDPPPPLVQAWLEHLTQGGRSHHTLKAYQRAWQHLAQWYQGTYGQACDPACLIARDLRDWKSYQQSVERVAPSTINQRLAAISSFYRRAVAQGRVPRDPTTDVASIRLVHRQPQSLSARQLRRLLRAVHNGGPYRDVAVIEVLAGTGIRVGELLQLQVGDVVLGDRSGWVTVREGKHGGYRELPLTKEVRQALAAYLHKHPFHQEDHDHYQNARSPLWWGKHGPLSHRSSVLRILHKYTLRARLDPIGPHVLRHTFATQYLQANPDDLRGLAALLGHSDLNTVMVYTEPTLQDLTTRLERMGELGVD